LSEQLSSPPKALEAFHLPTTAPSSKGEARRRNRTWIWLPILLLLGVGFYVGVVRRQHRTRLQESVALKKDGGSSAVIPVVAAKARRGSIGVYLTGLGSVTPIYTVTVKTRIDGQLMRILYKEGDLVHQGDWLAEIDPRPYEVQLEQANAQLARDQATLENARLDLTRYETLLPQNAIPEQQVATQKAIVAEDEAAIKTDQAQIDSAKLSISYCHIESPLTGRIGLRLVDPGNMVHASDATGLLVITQIQPISVIFTIPEDQLGAVLGKARSGHQLKVDAFDREMQSKIAQGTLTTFDNQIDPTTGTLKLRATFENQDNSLFPNQFVNARLLVEQKRGVTIVPTAAIQRNSQKVYAYVVGNDSKITVRDVKPGAVEGDDSEIMSGVAPGEVVVLSGVDKLQDGSNVNVHFEGKGAAKDSAAAR